MNEREILKLRRDNVYISGIYNYCDQWCERCSFVSRCMTYAICERNASDTDNKTFGDEIQITDLIVEFTEENEEVLDLMNPESEAYEFSDWSAEAEGNETLQAANGYLEITDLWWESVFKEILSASSTANADIIDAVEIITWYRHQIPVKLERAMTCIDPMDIDNEDSVLPSDSDGSAKVALIGIDRSVRAWRKLQVHFKDKKDDILNICLHLDRMRSRTERKFPNARSFRRPGFDTLN